MRLIFTIIFLIFGTINSLAYEIKTNEGFLIILNMNSNPYGKYKPSNDIYFNFDGPHHEIRHNGMSYGILEPDCSLKPNNFIVSVVEYHPDMDGRINKKYQITIDLSSDEFLTSILQELIDNKKSIEIQEQVITKYFSREIYSNNLLYKDIFIASEERRKKEELIENEKKQNEEKRIAIKKALEEEKEKRKQFLLSVYNDIKQGQIEKLSDNISFEDEQIMWNIMVDDNFGQDTIPQNANNLQREQIIKRNRTIKENIIKKYFQVIENSVVHGEFTFTEMNKIYTPKSDMQNELLDRAIILSEQLLKHDGILYSIPNNQRHEAIVSYAKTLLEEDPLDFGEENDYIITYNIPIVLSSIIEEDKLNSTDEQTEQYKPKAIIIINVPPEYIINYNYGTKFQINGKPQIIERNNSTNWEYNDDYIIIFDFNNININPL